MSACICKINHNYWRRIGEVSMRLVFECIPCDTHVEVCASILSGRATSVTVGSCRKVAVACAQHASSVWMCVCCRWAMCGMRCECAKYVLTSIAIDAFDVSISRGPIRHERDGVRQVSWHVGVCRASMWCDCDCAAMCVQCASAMYEESCVCEITHSHSYTCSQVSVHDAGRLIIST